MHVRSFVTAAWWRFTN